MPVAPPTTFAGSTSIPQIAAALGQPSARIRYIIESRLLIPPLGRFGRTKVYEATVADRVRDELAAMGFD